MAISLIQAFMPLERIKSWLKDSLAYPFRYYVIKDLRNKRFLNDKPSIWDVTTKTLSIN
jgi:hypothetical protein